jgi:hypothetical protein
MIRADNGEFVIFGRDGGYIKYSADDKPAPDQSIYRDKYGNELTKNATDYVCTNIDGDSCVFDQFDYCALLNNNTLFAYKKSDPPTCQIIECDEFNVEKDYGKNAKYTFNNGNLIVNGILVRCVRA